MFFSHPIIKVWSIIYTIILNIFLHLLSKTKIFNFNMISRVGFDPPWPNSSLFYWKKFKNHSGHQPSKNFSTEFPGKTPHHLVGAPFLFYLQYLIGALSHYFVTCQAHYSTWHVNKDRLQHQWWKKVLKFCKIRDYILRFRNEWTKIINQLQ